MTSEQQQIDEIFSEAVLLAPATRPSFLEQRCSGLAPSIRSEVDKLLEADQVSDRLAATVANPHLNVSKFIPNADLYEENGQRIGKYKLLEKIGEGGMGVVYMAVQEEPVERRVALKLIKPGMDSRQVIARFDAERQALAMMDHPNIAKVFDVGSTESGRPYFVMELVKGIPITEYCNQKKLDTKARLTVFISVCQAVAHAHQKGVIHRDIKPSNVLLAEYDEELVPKVIDFGVAKATTRKLTDKTAFTGFGQLIGTFEYMSPEQAKLNQLDVDTRSDIYSLGVLLYQLVTGTTPFDTKRLRAASLDEAVRIIAEEEPPKPSTRITTQNRHPASNGDLSLANANVVQGELDWIIMKSLEKKRDRRYQTAKEFGDDVRRHLDGESVEACPPTLKYRTQKFIRKYKTQVIVFGTLLTALSVTSLLGWRLYHASQREFERTSVERILRLAVQSGDLRDTKPVQSTRYALEAVRESLSHERLVLPAATSALTRAAANLGGTPLVGHRGRIKSASFSSDGRWLVTGGSTNDGARLWDLTSRDSCCLQHPKANVGHAAISRDNRWIATGANDGSVRLWNLRSDDPAGSFVELTGFGTFITSLVISDDSRRLVAGSDDGEVLLWDLTVEAPDSTRRVLLAPSKTATKAKVDISADSRWVVSANYQKKAYVWDLNADETNLPQLTLDAGEPIVSVAISPNARWLVTGSKSPRLWDLDSNSPNNSWKSLKRQNGSKSISITEDGKTLAVGGGDGSACIYDLLKENPASTCIVARGHTGIVREVSVSQDNRWLVTGGEDHKVRAWDLTSVDDRTLPQQKYGGGNIARLWYAETDMGVSHQLDGHDGWIAAMAIGSRNNVLATGDWVGNLRLWDIDSANPAHNRVVQRSGRVQGICCSPNGKWLAVGRNGPNSRLWRLNDRGTLHEAVELRGASDGIGIMAISSDSRWLVATSAVPAFQDASTYRRHECVARVWDLNAEDPGQPAFELAHQQSVLTVTISGDGKYVVTGSEDRTVKRWDLSNGCILSHSFDDHTAKVFSVATNYDGDLIGVGCSDGSAHLYDLKTKPMQKRQLHGHKKTILRIAISPNGRWLATGGSSEAPRLFDLESPRPLNGIVIPGHRSYTTSVAFSPDDQWLATASWSGVTDVWKLDSKSPLADPYASHKSEEPLHPLLFSLDSRKLLGGSEGVPRLLDLANPASMIDLPVGRGTAIALTPDGRHAIAGSGGSVTIWELTAEGVVDYAKQILGER